jgi:hypothetical protein
MSCSENMSNTNYIKELSRLAWEVVKRNNDIPISLLDPDRRKQTIIELKGRDYLEQWDKDLCEYGWLTGHEKWSSEHEIFEAMMDKVEGEKRTRARRLAPSKVD